MAAFLGVSELDFIERYTRLRPDRRGLALAGCAGGACIFLAGRDCRVQPVKPQQCRDFPNGWNFPGFEKICRALPQVKSASERARGAQRLVSPSSTHATSSV